MTIITQPLTEKKLAKSPQAKPLVQHESGNEGDVEGSPVIVTMRARRVSTTTTLCVFFTAFLVLATGIVGGVFLYRQFTNYKGELILPARYKENSLKSSESMGLFQVRTAPPVEITEIETGSPWPPKLSATAR
ncbi:hypothetical protein HPB51_026268 [Rhipicephalus microplus]|uniref:Integral membrane protein 2 n=1 Tax=Rhipicephalus microplus TaxID=6941 RepID=A0A9J6D857_RHIMP|nr:hypothetical protein HPB51_026268 [Rhipicephalus microplus]